MKSILGFLLVFLSLSFGHVEATGKISGKVTDLSTNLPLAGATVQIRLLGLLVDTQTTNSSGTYTTINLANGNYSVTASFSGYQLATNSPVTVANGNVNSNFQLAALGSISGVITGSTNGALISGATVQMIQSGNVISSTTTAADGSYSIGSLVPGSYTLSASATSFQSNSAPVAVTTGTNTEKNLSLIPKPGNVSGTISSASSLLGLSGASITFSLNGSSVATATSGLLGAYSVTNLSPATYSVSVSLTNYQTATGTAVVTSDATTVLNFALIPPAGILSGTAQDVVSGNVLSGASITVLSGSSTIATTTTGAEGAYSIPNLNPGTYTVKTALTNYQTLTSSATIVSNQTTTLNPSLQPLPGSVTGVVTNSQTSLGLAGATVKVSNGLVVAGTATTDGSGNFSLTGIAAGSYTLTATLANFVSFSQSITISAGGSITQNIALTPAVGIVTGVVQDLSSLSLLGGADVQLLQGSTVVASTTTGIAGLYSFSVLPGTYTIRVSKTNYVSATVSATVLSNVTATVNISLLASPGSVSGQITNLVTAAGLGNASVQLLQGSAVVASTTANASGNYTITGIAPGTYTLSASQTNYSTGSTAVIVTSNLTTTANLGLQPQNGAASGQIKNGVTLAPIQGALVNVYLGATLVTSTTTDANGNYTFNAVVPGSYSIEASASNYQTLRQSLLIASNLTTTTNLNLQPVPGIATGVITNALTSALVPGVTVTLVQGGNSVATTTTNALGVYSLTGVVPGTYTITASLTNFTTGSQVIAVSANATTTQNFSLQPQSGIVSGQISSSLTAGLLANVAINALQGSTVIGSTTTDINGNYTLSLPPGSYTINAVLNNYQTISQSATVSSNATTTLNIALTPIPGSIGGIVTASITGLPLNGVAVNAIQGSTTIASVQTNALGAYSLSNLAPGTYTVQFSLNNYQTVTQTKAVTSSNSTTADAVLVLQPGAISGTITNGFTNTPFSGVTVTALQGVSVIATATTQSNGSYTLGSLPPGTYTVSATALNFQTATQGSVAVTANGSTPVNLTLQPMPGTVSGIITDSVTTNPILGASISVSQNGITKGTALSLVNGSYTISGLQPGSYTLIVTATNYQSASQAITIASNATTSASVALLSTPGAIAGFVRNTDLSPISGAAVEVASGSNVIAATTSALDGSYTISGLAPASSGMYTFRASAVNHQTATQTSTITAGVTTPISFTLSLQPGTLTGSITNGQTALAISGANVQVLQGITVISSQAADNSGHYTITGLAPGSYTIVISATNFQTSTQGASILANATTTLNASLQPSPGSLSGVITDSATLSPLSLANVSVWNQGVLVASGTTLIDGSYSIGNLAPGNYTVVASLTNYQNSSVSAAIFANQNTALNLSLLSLPGSINGIVLNGVTPISGATVTIKSGNSTVATAVTDGSGNYISTGLSPGSYIVTASGTIYQSATQGAIVLANVSTPVNFNLVAFPGSITGVLTDVVTHAPINNAVITALSGNIAIGSTLTASDGSYTLAGLSPGAYLVTAAALNYQTLSSGASVQAQTSTTVNLSLTADPGSLTGRIIDAVSLSGIGGASVNITKGNILAASILTDTNGYYSASGLAPGAYGVAVQAANYQNGVKGAVILSNQSSTLDFSLLSSPGTISGQVLAGAYVNVYAGSLLIATQVADSAGNFAFANLAPGAYTVVAGAVDYETASQSVTVAANATTSITFNLQSSPGSCLCTVLDALTNLPLAGVNVTILQGNTIIATAVTDALGGCAFSGLAKGSYVIRAVAANYQGMSQGLTIQAGQTTGVSLSLVSDPGIISGVLTDLITGSPISSAVVDVINNGVTIATISTDNNGAYLVSSLAPKLYSIRFSAGNYQTSLQVAAVIANTTTILNAGLQPDPGSISCSILDSISATAVAGASVTLYNPLNNVAVANVLTDALGNCLISGVAPGLYTLVVNATNYQSLTVGVTVLANITVPLSLNIAPNPGSVHCVIKDAVSLLPITGCVVEALKNTTIIASSITDSLGECILTGLAPGSYTIRITATDYQISVRTVIILPNVQAELAVNLISDVGSLAGEVLDFLTLAILPQAQISLFSGQTLIATTVSDLLGNYIFTQLAPGSYTLRVTLLNFETFSATVTITPNHQTHQSCPMHSNPGNISGTVIDSVTSNPIASAEITIFNGSTSVADVFTDASGNYTVSGLTPRVNYTVRCSASNYQNAVQGATVQPNQTKVVNFSLLSQPGSLVGQVTDNASPIPNASIDLLQGSTIIASASTDSSGNYQIGSLAPGNYTVRASASAYQTLNVSATILANKTTTVNIILESNPGTLQGTVTDSVAHAPLANAQIQVRNGSILVGSITTDQDGHYTLPNLAPGNYTVTAAAMDYQTLAASGAIFANQTTTLNFTLAANPGTVMGTVTASNDNSPIPGANVSVYLSSNLIAEATTDSNGNYQISNLAPDVYTISVTAANFQNSSQGAQVRASTSTTVNFSLGLAPGNITGTVTGASATIDLLQGSTPISSTVTAADGSYHFNNLAPGNYTLRFQADSYQTKIIGAIVAANMTTTVDVTLVSQPGNIQGTAASGSSLLSNVAIDVLQNATIIESTLTDNAGNFFLSNLAPGNYIVRATLDTYQIAIAGVTVQPNMTATVNFNLNGLPGDAAGQITDATTGSLIANAEIAVLQGSILIATTLTDSNGNYLIENLAPGSYTIRASLNNYETGLQAVNISNASHAVANFFLTSQPGSVQGQITDASTGLPITTAYGSVNIIQGGVVVGSAISDANGNYAITGLPTRNYTLQVSAPNYQTVSQGVQIASNSTTLANIALQSQPGSISGVISDQSGPLSGVVINILQGSNIFATAISDNNGGYTASQLAPGSYTVRIQKDNYQTQIAQATVLANATIQVNALLVQDPGVIAGAVTDSSYTPLTGAVVVTKEGNVVINTVLTDIAGNYSIQGLAPGNYVIFASFTNYQTAFASVTVASNMTTPLSFVLLPLAGSATGHVADALTAQSLKAATIDILLNGIVIQSVLTDANGNYTVGGLAPGSYIIRGQAANYQIFTQGIFINANAATTSDFNLQADPGSISGEVKDANTFNPIPNATVQILQGLNLIQSIQTDGNGAYALQNLAPGNYTIHISAENYATISQGVQVQANVVSEANGSLTPNPATVTGIVIDNSTSTPLANVFAQIFQGNNLLGSALTDANGAFSIYGLTPGSYSLSLLVNDYQSTSTAFIVSAGQTISLNLSLIPSPGTLSGTVLDSNSILPVAGASVLIKIGTSSVASTITDVNGAWTISNLAPGSYAVLVTAPLYQINAGSALVTSGFTTAINTFLMADPGSVTGQIGDGSNPIIGATVEVLKGNIVIASFQTDAAGNYTLDSLAPGSYILRVSKSDYNTVVQGVVILANQSTTADVVLSLNPGTLLGLITDTGTSQAISGVTVNLFRGGALIASATTDVDGNYQIPNLQAGNYILTTTSSLYQTLSQGVGILANQTTVANLALMSQPGSIAGQITDQATGLGLAGASVSIISGQITIAATLSDSNGNYSVGGLAPGSYTVKAELNTYQTSTDTALVMSANTTTVNSALMSNPGIVTGQVTTLGGSPITSGSVVLHIIQGNIILASTLTDANGIYLIANLPAGTYSISVMAAGFQNSLGDAVIRQGQTTTLDFALAMNPGQVTGVVQDSGGPIGGASIQLFNGSVPVATVLTDGNGAYRISNLAPDQYSIQVTAAGYQSLTKALIIQANLTTTLNVNLAPNPGNIVGNVTDASTGLPLSGILANILQNSTVIATAISDSHGDFQIAGLAPGSYIVSISGTTYQTNISSVNINSGLSTNVSIALQSQPGTVSGTVVNSMATAVPDALIEALQNGQIVASSTTDTNGNYALAGLAPGFYTIRATANLYQVSLQGATVAANGQTTANFTLQTQPGSMSGFIKSGTTLIEGASIVILQGNIQVALILSGPDGSYNLTSLPVGNYQILVQASGYQFINQGLTIAPNGHLNVDFNLVPNPGSIQGQVTNNATSLPINGAVLSLFSGSSFVASVQTDSNGSYIFNNLAPGTYSVIVSASSFETATQAVSVAASTVTLADFSLMSQPGTISGSVVDSLNQPIGGAEIKILQNQNVITSVLTDSNGNYSVEGLSANSYIVSVNKTGFQLASQGAVVVPGAVVNASFSLNADIGSLNIHVTSQSSSPLSGATVQIIQNQSVLNTLLTDANGNSALSNLAPGSYTVRVAIGGYETAVQTALIVSGQTQSLTFILHPSLGSLNGYILDANTSMPIANANIEVIEGINVLNSIASQADGSFMISGLADGTYIVRITAANYQIYIASVSIVAGPSTTIAPYLAANPGSVSGLITDNISGLGVSNALVKILQNSIVIASQVTDSNGNYSIGSLAPGSYIVQVSSSNYQTALISTIIQANFNTTTNIGLADLPAILSGHISDSATQTPLSNVVINVYQDTILVATTSSDSNGAYQIQGLAPGFYQVNASLSGYQTGVLTSGNAATALDFSLSIAMGSVVGVVRDGTTSDPVAGASLSLFQGTTLIINALTDANGQYTFGDLASGAYTLVTNASNYQTAFQSLNISTSTLNADVALLGNPGAISGQIIDAVTFLPITQALVQIASGQTILRTTLSDGQGQILIQNLPAGYYTLTISKNNYQTIVQGIQITAGQIKIVNGSMQSAPGTLSGNVSTPATVYLLQGPTVVTSSLTDSSGNYVINGLAPGSYTVQAVASGYQFQTAGITLTAGGQVVVNFVLQTNPGTVQGIITDGTNPLPNVFVQLFNGSIVAASTFTDSLGSYILPNLTPGDYTILVALSGYQTATQGVQVFANAITTTNFTLLALPSSISGTVTSANGALPLAGVTIQSYYNNILIAAILTDANGEYFLDGLPAGSYIVIASLLGYQVTPAGVIVPPNSTQVHNFSLLLELGRLIGVLRDINGLPIAGGAISISQNNIVVNTVATDSEGTYTVPGLAPGSYVVTATGSGFQANTQGTVIIANQTATLDFTLQSDPATFSGIVQDTSSNPIVGAQVSLFQNGNIVTNAIAANDGSFHCRGLGAGNFSVLVTAPEYQTATAGITLTAGETTVRSFTLLEDVGSIQGVVQDMSSTPLANVNISILQGSIVAAVTLTDNNGNYTVSNLTPGNFVVVANLNNYQTGIQGAIVAANATTPVNFSLNQNIGSVEGTLTDGALGTPIAGATVNIFKQGVLVASGTTDNNGYYLITGLAPDNYEISIQAVNYQTVSESVVIIVNATAQVSQGLLSNPGSIHGIVTDSGVPITSATITVSAYSGNTLILSALTDNMGSYSFTGLQPGSYILRASSNGYQLQVQSAIVVAGQTTEADFSLMANGGSCSGTILDALTSSPIANALIQVLDGSILLDSTIADVNGNFAFSNLAPGKYNLSVNALNYQISILSVQIVSLQTTTLTINLQANPGTVAGTVIDNSSTAAVRGAVVDILQGSILVASVLTDANGQYIINQLPEGSYTLRVTAAGYQTLIQGCIVQANSTTIENLQLQSQPGTVTGNVIDASTSLPISDVLISLLQNNHLVASAVTDTNGVFTIPGIAAGSYTVQATALGYQNGIEGLTLNLGETVNIGISLQNNPATIQGTITDFLHQPITGASVAVNILQGNFLVAQVLTDANGLYSIPNLKEGSYIIQASAASYQTASKALTVTAGQTVTIDFALNSNPGAISGIITDANSSLGLSQVQVTVFNGAISVGSVITDSNGNYMISGISPGTYTVSATLPLYQSATSVVNVVSNATVNANIALLSNPGTFLGIIADVNGSPIGGASIEVSFNGVAIASILTSPNGSYHVSGLPVGNYIIKVTASGFQSFTIGASVQAGQTVTENFTLQANPGQLHGLITNGGQPIANALVQALQNNVVASSILTDAQGNFLIQNLAPGTYTIRISASGFQTAVAAVTITANQTTENDAELLANPGSIQGIILDNSANPLPNISIQVFDGLVLIAAGATDSTGSYTINGLASGTYSVTAGGQGYALTTQNATVLGNQTTALNFTLSLSQGSVSGSVSEGVTGNPLPGVSVNLFSGTTLIAVTLTDSNGLYSFFNIPPGTYSLRITAPNYQIKVDAIVIVDGQNTLADEILEPLPGILSGQIIDALTGLPVSNVTIIVYGGEFPVASTLSDGIGHYSVPNLAPGTYTVEFRRHTYQTIIQNVTILPNAITIFDLLIGPIPNGPSQVTQSPVKQKFATQTLYANRIEWRAATSIQVVSYKIYRDGMLIGVQSAKKPLFFIDANIHPKERYAYTVTAVNSLGLESVPVEAARESSRCNMQAACNF